MSFAGEGFLPLAVEKVAHVDGLLRLGYLDLLEPVLADDLAQRVADFPDGRKRDVFHQAAGVFDHRRKVHRDRRAIKVGELLRHKGAGQLDLALAANVVKDHVIAVADAAYGSPVAIDQHDRF